MTSTSSSTAGSVRTVPPASLHQTHTLAPGAQHRKPACQTPSSLTRSGSLHR
ncbi:hypothetical protein G647_06014 [Cladophialophora carrionii CBS 160.54]|uniref:Uncharacterized protein n=1 Tax=Cladophialophora carrionii CBS 160.54 TaxID=1279043 RepID=V9D4X9_9EURO|nr:uncharacterized protein G647_06014 [Cladophialophora carrionii CBS 160.54]ETI21944.1 hypothetical protein G647_06014 [Cladophialophora carrionii CBS 160.54]